MKILIIGLGSIGQRHLRNLSKINRKFQFIAVRKKFHVPILTNKLKVSSSKKTLREKYNIKYFTSLNSALKENPKIALICTPPVFHIKEAIQCLKKNCHVFIEKPLGSTTENLQKLKKILLKKKLITMMGFQMRFEPIYIYLKNFLRKKNIGKIFHAEIYNGEHIAKYHEYENYRISCSAKKSLGGGVVLSQIHELDYFLDLFKKYKIKIISSKTFKNSNLEIDTEDTLDSLFLLKNLNNKFTARIHLDFYTIPKKRKIEIYAEKGTITADFKRKIFTYKMDNKKFEKKFSFERNTAFMNEIKYFVNKIKRKKKISENLSIHNGIKTLQFAIKLKNKTI